MVVINIFRSTNWIDFFVLMVEMAAFTSLGPHRHDIEDSRLCTCHGEDHISPSVGRYMRLDMKEEIHKPKFFRKRFTGLREGGRQ
jgi:hypothetical protein